MNTIGKIVKNTSVLFLAQIIIYLIAFFYTIYIARYLGVEQFGILSFAIAISGIFGVITNGGLNTLLVREVARDKSLINEFLGNSLSIKIILAILTFILIAITVNLLAYSQEIIYVVYLIILSVIFTEFSQIFYSIFQAFEKMEYQSIGTTLNAIFVLLGVLLAIYLKLDIFVIASVYFVSAVIVFICNLIMCAWKFALPKIKFDLEFWKSKMKEAWPFAITGISINLYTWIDTILLSLFIGELVVGWYTAAYRIIIILLVIPIIFNSVIFPSMSKFFISSKDSLKISFEKYLKLLMLIGIPLGVGITLLSDKIILLIFGSQYVNSIIALQILIWSMVLIFARSSFERLLEASNRQLTVTKVFIIGIIFNVILNLIFIPKYSYIGAALITVLTDLLNLIFFIYIIKSLEITISKNIAFKIAKIMFASLIMGILIYILNANIIISAIIGITVYIIIVLILKIIDEDEINIIKSFFQ